jgi:nucleoside-diphosphate-sugar epimerase
MGAATEGFPDRLTMRIVVTGNMGYVGPVLARFLRSNIRDCKLVGYDSGYFGHCLTGSAVLPEVNFDLQYMGDVRELPREVLAGADAVVHLAAVSNDPMGNRYQQVTADINQQASIRVAELAREAGVKNFVFASSCSMYGYAEGGARKETDPTNPLTAYARSKIGTENALKQMDLGGMTVTSLRFATACGMSDRLRLDLVLNDFVACAVTSGEITVLSDGTPWRPLIDVEDMSRAIAWAVQRAAADGGHFLAVNVGRDEWNYQVKDLAEAVAAAVPGTKVSVNTAAPPDKRSYRVDFSLFNELAPGHIPQLSLDESIRRLHAGLASMGFADKDFRNSPYMRLKTLERHIAAGRLGADLRWIKQQ